MTKKCNKSTRDDFAEKVKHLIPPIKSGSINSVVKATLEDDVDVIMRMHPNALRNGYFWAEKTIANKAQKAGVPTYDTLAIDGTKNKCRLTL